jgi:hypothetical protein
MSLVPEELLNKSSAPSAADKVSQTETDDEIKEVTVITSSPPVPPTPLLPVALIIIFVINGKEMGERSIVIEVNEDFESFKNKLDELVEKQLPNHVTIYAPFARVVYKQVYVTKAQSSKRKDLALKDFRNEQDHAGVLYAIQNSNPSKMTVVVRAFITVPKEDFEEQIQLLISSQRMVPFSS